MTSAEARNADRTVAEWRSNLRECVADARQAGVSLHDIAVELNDMCCDLEGEIEDEAASGSTADVVPARPRDETNPDAAEASQALPSPHR